MYSFKRRRMDRGKERKGGKQMSIWVEVGGKGVLLTGSDRGMAEKGAVPEHEVAVLRIMDLPIWKRLCR